MMAGNDQTNAHFLVGPQEENPVFIHTTHMMTLISVACIQPRHLFAPTHHCTPYPTLQKCTPPPCRPAMMSHFHPSGGHHLIHTEDQELQTMAHKKDRQKQKTAVYTCTPMGTCVLQA